MKHSWIQILKIQDSLDSRSCILNPGKLFNALRFSRREPRAWIQRRQAQPHLWVTRKTRPPNLRLSAFERCFNGRPKRNHPSFRLLLFSVFPAAFEVCFKGQPMGNHTLFCFGHGQHRNLAMADFTSSIGESQFGHKVNPGTKPSRNQGSTTQGEMDHSSHPTKFLQRPHLPPSIGWFGRNSKPCCIHAPFCFRASSNVKKGTS